MKHKGKVDVYVTRKAGLPVDEVKLGFALNHVVVCQVPMAKGHSLARCNKIKVICQVLRQPGREGIDRMSFGKGS